MAALSADVYYGRGFEGKNGFVNLRTGAEVALIPDGYVVKSQHSYNQFPAYVVLEKDGALYSFRFKDKALAPIADVSLGANDEVYVSPSLTEEGKFFLLFETYDPNEVGGMYPIAIASRSYFFDAQENALEPSVLDRTTLPSCYEYDSLRKRFLEWRCGEGVGSVLPVVEKDLKGVEKGVLFSDADFDRSVAGAFVRVDYSNGLFYGMDEKIVVWDPRTNEKQTFAFSEDVRKTIDDDAYPYSITYDSGTKTIVIGQGDGVLLLRFDASGIIVAARKLAHEELYANFVFINDGKAYYDDGLRSNAINVLDLKTWEIEKTIPVQAEEDITLVRG